MYSAVTIQRHIYSHQISRLARTEPPPSLVGRSFNLGGNSGLYSAFVHAHTEPNNYVVKDPTESKTAEKLRTNTKTGVDLPSFPDMVTESYIPHTFTPTNYEYNFKKPRNIEYSNKQTSSDVISGLSVDKLKYPSNAMNDVFYGYDGDFHNDDEDVRTSGRNTYENYASFFYHNPYDHSEYDHKNVDMDKAKDKRYADISEKVIPVHEHIENETFFTPAYEASTIPNDNPIGGNGPFFSFVLNDYFDRNHDEDSLTFKGLGVDWGKDFDHESYRSADDTRRDRRLENYFTPANHWMSTVAPDSRFPLGNPNNDEYVNSVDQSVTESTHNQNFGTVKHKTGDRKFSNYRKNDGALEHKYEGFKDFLDSFANKFGLAENKGDSNFIRETSNDKGEKKNGFHRIYHKDEFLEDKEFFDRSNSSKKAADKASSNFNFGGTEAILRSQALAAERNAANIDSNFRNSDENKYVKAYKGDFNTLGNNFDKYIHVAKQAAKSNNADYIDQ